MAYIKYIYRCFGWCGAMLLLLMFVCSNAWAQARQLLTIALQ